MRGTAQAAALLCLGLSPPGVCAEEWRLASGLEDQEEVYSWENETFSLGVSAGWLTGQSHEFAHDSSGNKISELIWDISHAFAINADFGIRMLPALKLNARGTWGGNIDSQMDDYDWLGLPYGQTDWTDHSSHDDTKLDRFARFDINLQYDFLQQQSLTFSGLAGARFTGVRFKAHGGDFLYTSDPEFEFRDVSGSFADDELVITYEQNWAVPYLGLAASLNSGSVRLTGSIIGSPLAYGSSDDDHWLRAVHFEEDFERTNFVAASAEAAYLFGGHYQVFLNANGERYFRTGADTTMTGSEGNAELDDHGGADHENLQISLGFRVTN